MSGLWQENIIRIIGSDGAVFGTGTLVETLQDGVCVLTCAHVLNEVLGYDQYSTEWPSEDEVFFFDIPVRSREKRYKARVLEWAPPRKSSARIANPVCDIALLKIEADIPSSVRLYSADDFIVEDLADKKVMSFGFSTDTGELAQGTLNVEDAGGWFHFVGDNELASFVEPGFSGAPLFDEKRSRIVGMVVAMRSDEGKQVAYAQSARNIWKGCPQLARPYLGLKDFDEENTAFFFGREDFVEKLRTKLNDHPITGVTAASGSGKSSVIKAGLIPQLRKERDWCVISMRPAHDPWEQLAIGLLPHLYPDLAVGEKRDKRKDLTEELRQDPSHLVERLRDIAQSDDDANRVLIFVDQFEELFTQAGHANGRDDGTQEDDAPDEGDKVADGALADTDQPGRLKADFRDWMVATATLDGDLPIQWIYTLRADFSGPAFRYRPFTDALKGGDEKLADMNEAELRRSITCPAEELNASFQKGIDGGPSVSERIADAVQAKPGSLPLMAHLLEKLWERLDKRQITHEAYDALDGLEGALNQHANEVYQKRLTEEQQKQARRLFSRLVKIEKGNEPTRRVQSRADLGEELWEVADILAKQRLLQIRGDGSSPTDQLNQASGTTDENNDYSQQTVEVAHEALLRSWTLLQKWLQEDLGFLLWRQRLEQRIADWKESKSDTDLLQNERLAEANSWVNQRNDSEFNAAETDYIRHSNELEQQRIEQQRIEDEKALRVRDERIQLLSKQRRWAIAAVTILILALVGGGVAILSLNSLQDITEKQKTKAENDAARYAAAIAAGQNEQGNYTQALLIAREVLPSTYTSALLETRSSALVELSRAVGALDLQPGILKGHGDDVWHAVFSPDGNRIVTAASDNTARIWDAATGSVIHALTGHGDDVVHAVFSPDGNRIVTASSDNTARVWDTETGGLIYVLKTHEEGFIHATFSPDGSRILATTNNTVRIWDGATGSPIHVLKGQHEEGFIHAAFSPDGDRILTASSDNARIWDAATGSQIHVLIGHEQRVDYAIFSPDGSNIVTASFDDTARIWDAATGSVIHVLKGHEDSVVHAVFSPDGSRIVTVSQDSTARIWDAETGSLIHVLKGHEEGLWHAAFSPDGRRIITASNDNTARLWNGTTGTPIHVIKGHEEDVIHAVFSPDDNIILTITFNDIAKLWDVATGSLIHALKGHEEGLIHAAFSPDGNRALTASHDSTARIWDVATGSQINVLKGHEEGVWHAVFSPNGSNIVTASFDDTARIWDVATGNQIHVLKGHDGDVVHAVFSPDGSRIATASFDGTARIWDVATGAQIHFLKGHEADVLHVEFSPDGSRIATASQDSTARIWDAETGSLIHVLKGNGGSFYHAVFSPDGSRIVTDSFDGTARIWDVATGNQIHVLKRHEDSVVQVVFSPDGSRILTASLDNTARIWDVATGSQINVLTGHEQPVNHAAFSTNGSRIVTGSQDNTARLWNVSPRTLKKTFNSSSKIEWQINETFSQGLLERSHQILNRNLTQQERRSILKER